MTEITIAHGSARSLGLCGLVVLPVLASGFMRSAPAKARGPGPGSESWPDAAGESAMFEASGLRWQPEVHRARMCDFEFVQSQYHPKWRRSGIAAGIAVRLHFQRSREGDADADGRRSLAAARPKQGSYRPMPGGLAGAVPRCAPEDALSFSQLPAFEASA